MAALCGGLTLPFLIILHNIGVDRTYSTIHLSCWKMGYVYKDICIYIDSKDSVL